MADSIIIALDAMGGEHAPACVVDAAEIALRKQPNLRFLFVGDEAAIAPLLKLQPAVEAVSRILHTPDKVSDEMKPSQALRQGKNSSMQLAINAVKSGEAQAVVSGGSTGALMAMSKLSLRMLPGIYRPAAASMFPTQLGACVMLDLGANLEASAEELFQYAIMGDAYARAVLGMQSPRIGLLNVGEEETKGHPEIREAAELIRQSATKLNFIGFVEGNDVPMGEVDVAVTDGFTGNMMLKTAEGTAKLVRKHIHDAFNNNWTTKFSYLLASKTMKDLRKRMDPRRYNGAMFLGLNGVVVKSHGGSDEYAFSFAIRKAADLVEKNTNARISQELEQSGIMKQKESKTEAADA